MSTAGPVSHRRKPAMQQHSGVVDYVIPLKSRARIYLVGLDMKMTEHSLVIPQLLVWKFLGEQMPGGILWVITRELGKDFYQGCRQTD
jgi:hypothetical protein